MVDVKVQPKFTEAVGNYQMKAIATNSTIDIMKNDEYAQKNGAELLTN